MLYFQRLITNTFIQLLCQTQTPDSKSLKTERLQTIRQHKTQKRKQNTTKQTINIKTF